MSSYNKLNGEFSNEKKHLLQDVLRGEWGYNGVVVTDWAGCNSRVEGAKAGNELEMPSCKYGADDLVKAVESGEIEESVLDGCIDRRLTLVYATDNAVKQAPETFDKEEHHAFARKCAEESIVLLENKNNALPLSGTEKVAVIGDFAQNPRYQGAGSSVVNPTKLDKFIECVKDVGGGIFRPVRELKGFKKVFLKAGESKRVEIPFNEYTFRYFNVKTDKWEEERGRYMLEIAANCTDVKLTEKVYREGTTNVLPYEKEKLPSYYSADIKKVSDEEFTYLLGREIPPSGYDFYKKNRMVIHENCTVADLRYSKGWTGRAFSGVIRFAIKFMRGIGKRTTANTLVMGVLHQPVRGIAKFGSMSRRQMAGLLIMFNGKFFKGLKTFLTKEKKTK